MPNVVFPCAALVERETDRLTIYYGGADTVVCLAHGHLSEIHDRARLARSDYGYGLQRIEAAIAAAARRAPSAARSQVISVGCFWVATSLGRSAKTSRS